MYSNFRSKINVTNNTYEPFTLNIMKKRHVQVFFFLILYYFNLVLIQQRRALSTWFLCNDNIFFLIDLIIIGLAFVPKYT